MPYVLFRESVKRVVIHPEIYTPLIQQQQLTLHLKKKSSINGKKNKPITTAPMNSLIPDKNDQRNAFFLFFVDAYMGTETAIPSGIL